MRGASEFGGTDDQTPTSPVVLASRPESPATSARGPASFRPVVTRLEPPHPLGGFDEVDRWPNGNVCYLLAGELHRTDGPAFVGADGSAVWLQHGLEHRLDGPAVCAADGEVEFWVNGHQVEEALLPDPDRW